jgi:hypothetical protein
MTWPPTKNGLMPAWALTDTEISRELGNATGKRLDALRSELESRSMIRAKISTRTDDT